jgi:hypothetical protein
VPPRGASTPTKAAKSKKKAPAKATEELTELQKPFDPSGPVNWDHYKDFGRYYVEGGDEDDEAAGGDARYKPDE